MQTQNLVELEFFLQKFCVDLFSQSEESQKFRGDKFSRFGENSTKFVKVKLRKNYSLKYDSDSDSSKL